MNHTEAAAVLGVSPSASRDEIQAAARAQMRLLHPDRFGGADAREQATASAAFQRVLRAQEVLLTEEPNPVDNSMPPSTSDTSKAEEPRQPPRSSRPHSQRPRTDEPRNDDTHRHQRSNDANTETPRQTGEPRPNEVRNGFVASRAFGVAVAFVAVLTFGKIWNATDIDSRLIESGWSTAMIDFVGFGVVAAVAVIAYRVATNSLRERNPHRGDNRTQSRSTNNLRATASHPKNANTKQNRDVTTEYGDVIHWGDANVTMDAYGKSS